MNSFDVTRQVISPIETIGVTVYQEDKKSQENKKYQKDLHIRKKFIMRKCRTYLSYIKYFEQARMEYFKESGLYDELYNNDYNLVITEMNCQIRSRVRYGEIIEVLMRTRNIDNSCINLEYEIIDSTSSKIIFTGNVEFMLMDNKNFNYITIPPNIRQGLYEF